MQRQEILKTIRNTEVKFEDERKKSEAEARAIIADAETAARRIEEKRLTESILSVRSMMDSSRVQADKERNARIQLARKDGDALKLQASTRHSVVFQTIYSKLKDAFHVPS